MYRKEFIDILLNRPTGIRELAVILEEKVVDVEDDLRHLQKSLRNEPYHLHVEPAQCRKCGFRFSADKLHKPSRCPRCKGNWISEPLISVRAD